VLLDEECRMEKIEYVHSEKRVQAIDDPVDCLARVGRVKSMR
jgi:hypothetical protein